MLTNDDASKLRDQCRNASGKKINPNAKTTVHWCNEQGDIACAHPIEHPRQWTKAYFEVSCHKCMDKIIAKLRRQKS